MKKIFVAALLAAAVMAAVPATAGTLSRADSQYLFSRDSVAAQLLSAQEMAQTEGQLTLNLSLDLSQELGAVQGLAQGLVGLLSGVVARLVYILNGRIQCIRAPCTPF